MDVCGSDLNVQNCLLFVTSLDDEDDETTGLELGAVDYITKPIKPSIVLARVRNHLEMKRQRDLLKLLSHTDSLTCLANRRSFFEKFETECRRSARSGNPISLIMMDVDFFKAYNDHYGHVAGDKCLCQIGQILCNATKRAGDIAARYGGEEFVVLLPETNLEGSVHFAEALKNKIEALSIKHAYSEVADIVTVSMGVSTIVPTIDDSSETFLKEADAALYEAKENGRNRVRTAPH
jgi:diguanylate cyclase (GGDEF)-like protein